MNQIKLLKDWPNLPAGTVLTQDASGNYVDSKNGLFLSQAFVDANPLSVINTTPVVLGTTYFYVDDMGLVKQTTFDANGQTRKDFGNYFSTAQSALDASVKLSPIYKQLSAGVPVITITSK